MLKSVCQAELWPGPVTGPAPLWMLQQESWPSLPWRDGCTPRQGIGELAPPLAWGEAVPVARTDQLLCHPDPPPGPWVGPLEHLPHLYMKRLTVQNDSCRIPMTQGNSRVSERGFGEVPVMMGCQSQRSWTSSMTHCKEGLWMDARIYCSDTPQLPRSLGWMTKCWRGGKNRGAREIFFVLN